jgi:hypothetical protein
MPDCNGKCSACGGCAKQLTLTQQEIDMLRTLGQIPFLPIARRADDMIPVYLEDHDYTKEEYSLILQVLEKKGLISLDYDKALSGFDMSAYKGYPVHGSMALTAKGQNVLEMLETQGIEEE